jgi:hypothetical protein
LVCVLIVVDDERVVSPNSTVYGVHGYHRDSGVLVFTVAKKSMNQSGESIGYAVGKELLQFIRTQRPPGFNRSLTFCMAVAALKILSSELPSKSSRSNGMPFRSIRCFASPGIRPVF